ncbi:MAG: dipeptide/oligopeptide/nickel ABC transporter permease/ATP-binding protein, partial [Proteobacteria bacterium]|nr:dipeptide/oligopeptide/nickel ABC transporter permease/ATP-binding protein [Pseudomonadota bacterium]
VALASAILAGLIGVTLGLVGGYFRGAAETVTLRLTDVILSVPPVLLALLIVTIAGPGVATLIVALSILFAPAYARLVYGEVLTIRELEYVEATRALGASRLRILLRTVLPGVLPAVLVQLSLTVASAIVIESGLSFLGLGVVPPTPSWGLMIRGARTALDQTWLPLLWPCLMLLVTVHAANRLCDALRDVLDPTLRGVVPALARSAPAQSPIATETATSRRPADAHAPLLDIVGLETRIATPHGEFAAVADVTLSVGRGETVALVGESGSGKTMIGLSVLSLVPSPTGRISHGSIMFAGRDGASRDLTTVSQPHLQAVRGNEIAMIFQEPMTSLNPVLTIGRQIGEALARHRNLTGSAARRETIRLLAAV